MDCVAQQQELCSRSYSRGDVMGKRAKSNKKEFSKMMCVVAFVIFLLLGAWMIYRYYDLMSVAIVNDSSITPDASLPIAGITFIFAPILSYLTYQAGLKNSRNKYGVDENGQPYCESND